MNWGFLGYGAIAPKVHESLKQLPGHRLHALASRSNASTLAQEMTDIVVYDDYEELCRDDQVDIVYISTTHNFHLDHAMLAMAAGKHVLCEKPLSTSARKVRQMIDCARTHGVFFMEAIWMCFLPAYRSMLDQLHTKQIGEVKWLKADFSFSSHRDPQSRLWNPSLAGGSLWDVGIYCLALSQDIFGRKPQHLKSLMHLTETGVDEHCQIIADYGDGQMAHFASSIGLETDHDAFIYGTQGSMHSAYFWRMQSYSQRTTQVEKRVSIPFESTGYLHELHHVSQRIAAGHRQSDIIPWTRSLELAELMDWAFASAKMTES